MNAKNVFANSDMRYLSFQIRTAELVCILIEICWKSQLPRTNVSDVNPNKATSLPNVP